jgi:hypothetical protein
MLELKEANLRVAQGRAMWISHDTILLHGTGDASTAHYRKLG